MTAATEGLARSVQTRLVNHAKAIGADPNVVLARFATERFLYRLSISPYAERFVLKGALLLLAWLGETLRIPGTLATRWPLARARGGAVGNARALPVIAGRGTAARSLHVDRTYLGALLL